MPMNGSSPTCWVLRYSAIGTSPSRTARRHSGPLNPSWPPDFTSISIAPPVAFFTSSAKRRQLTMWKLASGQTVASGSFIGACARTTAGAITSAPSAGLQCRPASQFHECPDNLVVPSTVERPPLRCNSHAKPPMVRRDGNGFLRYAHGPTRSCAIQTTSHVSRRWRSIHLLVLGIGLLAIAISSTDGLPTWLTRFLSSPSSVSLRLHRRIRVRLWSAPEVPRYAGLSEAWPAALGGVDVTA